MQLGNYSNKEKEQNFSWNNSKNIHLHKYWNLRIVKGYRALADCLSTFSSGVNYLILLIYYYTSSLKFCFHTAAVNILAKLNIFNALLFHPFSYLWILFLLLIDNIQFSLPSFFSESISLSISLSLYLYQSFCTSHTLFSSFSLYLSLCLTGAGYRGWRQSVCGHPLICYFSCRCPQSQFPGGHLRHVRYVHTITDPWIDRYMGQLEEIRTRWQTNTIV